MALKPIIKSEQVLPLAEAFSRIASQTSIKDEVLDLSITPIEGDRTTGAIKLQHGKITSTAPHLMLEQLINLGDLRGRTKEITSRNIGIVTKLGAVVLEELVSQDKASSTTALLEIQRAVRQIGESAALAFGFSDLPREQTAALLRGINATVNPNPRLAKHYAGRDFLQEGLALTEIHRQTNK